MIWLKWLLSLVLRPLATVLDPLKAKLAAVVVAIALAGLAFLKVFLAGKAAERASQTRENLKAMRKRKEIDDEVSAMGHADLDERFAEYVRDDR